MLKIIPPQEEIIKTPMLKIIPPKEEIIKKLSGHPC